MTLLLLRAVCIVAVVVVVGVVASLAADFHHACAGLDVGAVRVIRHVRHADERVVQGFAGCDSTFLGCKKVRLSLDRLSKD
jgi:hypothetical protein